MDPIKQSDRDSLRGWNVCSSAHCFSAQPCAHFEGSAGRAHIVSSTSSGVPFFIVSIHPVVRRRTCLHDASRNVRAKRHCGSTSTRDSSSPRSCRTPNTRRASATHCTIERLLVFAFMTCTASFDAVITGARVGAIPVCTSPTATDALGQSA